MGMSDSATSGATTYTTTTSMTAAQPRSLAEIAAAGTGSWCPDCRTRAGGALCEEGCIHASRLHQAVLDGNITHEEFKRALGGGGIHLRLIKVA